MCFLRVQSQYLPRNLAFRDDERRDGLCPKAPHGLEAMPAVWGPENASGCDDRDDRVEKVPSLANDVGETFVVSVGKVALKRRRFDLIDGENREQRRMTAKWFPVQAHHAAPGFLDRFRGVRGRSFWLS